MQTHEAYLSPRGKEIVGFRNDELPNLESTFFDLIHLDDMPRVNETVKLHVENGEPFRVELRLRHKDGNYRWIVTRGEGEAFVVYVAQEHGHYACEAVLDALAGLGR